MNRVLGSTKVPIAEPLLAPMIKFSLTVSGHSAIVCLSGPRSDGEHVTELAAPFGRPAAGFARGAFGRQPRVQIGAQLASAMDVEALVKGFMAHP
ncbi:hypothetical protein LAUMK136_05618 [Mycobacterium attenuatum]|uniref:Uncharacterized protein n=1 Tax=Mycobacterium attenuatum TaxID=2341086 RepID=A0A498QHM9_9MYCO|nr:hypothetical protein [Mycobacterium attenuatum]VBA44403.1 hypothetical protein LAUMK136_05618 [Mycobacterium attenuatum]